MEYKIYFNGFWSGFHNKTNAVHEQFFIDLMKKVYNTYDIKISESIADANILIENTQVTESVRNTKVWLHTYLYSAESYIRSDRNEYTCVLYGQRNHANTVNVPLFVPYIYCSLGQQFQTDFTPLNITEVPKKDIVVVITNKNGSVRNEFISALEKSGLSITFAGEYKNNIGGRFIPNYSTQEFNELVKEHKFILSMENSEEDTYITEKIIHGIRAGIVPVYWGSKRIQDYINKDRLITINSINDIKYTIYKMKSMKQSEWLSMVNTLPFTEYGSQYTIESIASHIRNIIAPLKLFPKITQTVFICNQDFEPERYKRIQEFCDKYKITTDMCKFISPTYKHTITDEIYKKYVKYDYMKYVYGKSNLKGDVSLTLNTRAAYEYIEKTYKDGLFLVLESDAMPTEAFNMFNTCINKLCKNLSENRFWSAVSLGQDEGNIFDKSYNQYDSPYRKSHEINVKKLLENTKEDLSLPSDGDIRFIRKFNTRCTDSHLFTYKGITQMVKHFQSDTNYATPIDYYFINVLENDMDFKYYWSSITYFNQASKTIESSSIR